MVDLLGNIWNWGQGAVQTVQTVLTPKPPASLNSPQLPTQSGYQSGQPAFTGVTVKNIPSGLTYTPSSQIYNPNAVHPTTLYGTKTPLQYTAPPPLQQPAIQRTAVQQNPAPSLMDRWQTLTEPLTYVKGVGGAFDTLAVGLQNLQGNKKADMKTLPSEAMQTYFAPAGTSVPIMRDGVYKGDWKYEGSRPYFDLSTPLTAVQNLGSIAAGKGPIGNYSLKDLNPLYLQTDKEMLAKQSAAANNQNKLISDIVPLKMELGSVAQGLWDKPHEDPVGAAMYYATPVGFGAIEGGLGLAAIKSPLAGALIKNPITQNIVKTGMMGMMGQMVADTALSVPGYQSDPLGFISSGGKTPLVGRTVKEYDPITGKAIYVSQDPQSTGRRTGGMLAYLGLMYAGSQIKVTEKMPWMKPEEPLIIPRTSTTKLTPEEIRTNLDIFKKENPANYRELPDGSIYLTEPLAVDPKKAWTDTSKRALQQLIGESLPIEKQRLLQISSEAQKALKTDKIFQKKTEYTYKPERLNENAWNFLTDTLSSPKYKDKVILAGQSTSTPFTIKGGGRDISLSDIDLLVKDEPLLRSLQKDLTKGFKKYQPELYETNPITFVPENIVTSSGESISINKPVAKKAFAFVNTGETRSIIDAHTFETFPAASQKGNTLSMTLPGGKSIRMTTPEYQARAKLSTGITGLVYDPKTGNMDLVSKGIKNLPDIISSSQQASADVRSKNLIADIIGKRRYTLSKKGELFENVGKGYKDLLFSEEFSPIKGTSETDVLQTQTKAARATVKEMENPLIGLEPGKTKINIKGERTGRLVLAIDEALESPRSMLDIANIFVDPYAKSKPSEMIYGASGSDWISEKFPGQKRNLPVVSEPATVKSDLRADKGIIRKANPAEVTAWEYQANEIARKQHQHEVAAIAGLGDKKAKFIQGEKTFVKLSGMPLYENAPLGNVQAHPHPTDLGVLLETQSNEDPFGAIFKGASTESVISPKKIYSVQTPHLVSAPKYQTEWGKNILQNEGIESLYFGAEDKPILKVRADKRVEIKEANIANRVNQFYTRALNTVADQFPTFRDTPLYNDLKTKIKMDTTKPIPKPKSVEWRSVVDQIQSNVKTSEPYGYQRDLFPDWVDPKTPEKGFDAKLADTLSSQFEAINQKKGITRLTKDQSLIVDALKKEESNAYNKYREYMVARTAYSIGGDYRVADFTAQDILGGKDLTFKEVPQKRNAILDLKKEYKVSTGTTSRAVGENTIGKTLHTANRDIINRFNLPTTIMDTKFIKSVPLKDKLLGKAEAIKTRLFTKPYTGTEDINWEDELFTNKPKRIGDFGSKTKIQKSPLKHKPTNDDLDRKMNNILFGGNSRWANPVVKAGRFGRKQKTDNPHQKKSIYTQSNKQLDRTMNDLVFGNNVKWGTAPVLIGKFGSKTALRKPNAKPVKKQLLQTHHKPTRMETLLDRKMDNILFGNELIKQSRKDKRIKRITE